MSVAGGRFSSGRKISLAFGIIWDQHRPWGRWWRWSCHPWGLLRKGQTKSRQTSARWIFFREWTNWPLFLMTPVLIFKVMVSTCQSNAIYSSPALLKRCKNCLCGTSGNSVLWVCFRPSPVYLNCSWSLSIIVHHFQIKLYSSILKLV